MPRIAILSHRARALDPHADPRNVAMIRRRHGFWGELARQRGWDMALWDTAAVGGSSGDLRGSVSWIDLPMLPREAYGDVFARATRAGAACVHQHPEDVERVLGLDRTYPVLVRAGVPTPRTAFVPVDEAVAADIGSPADVRRRLTEAVYGALFDVEIDPHDGVFIRGLYSSLKSANPEHYFGNNQADIEATTFEVIHRLRTSLELGGLAFREYLDLERIDLPALPGDRDAVRVPFEVRLTVLHGRLLMASYHGPFEVFTDEVRSALEQELTDRLQTVKDAVLTLAPALLSADLPASYVADVAFPRGRAPVVLELNPIYAAGYNVPAAHALLVAALGAHLAERAAYPSSPWQQVLDDAAELAGSRVEQSPGVWLFDRVDAGS